MPRKIVRKPKPAGERKPARAPTFLNEVQKLFVVDRLAEYDTIAQVRTAYRERFGRDVLAATVEHYDPTRSGSKRLRGDLAARFHQRRADFTTLLELIPLANRAVRLKERSSIYERQAKKGNDKMALTALDSIQAEMDAVERAKRPIGLSGAAANGRPTSTTVDFEGAEIIDGLFSEAAALGPSPVLALPEPARPVPHDQASVAPTTTPAPPPAAMPSAAVASAALAEFFDDLPPELR